MAQRSTQSPSGPLAPRQIFQHHILTRQRRPEAFGFDAIVCQLASCMKCSCVHRARCCSHRLPSRARSPYFAQVSELPPAGAQARQTGLQGAHGCFGWATTAGRVPNSQNIAIRTNMTFTCKVTNGKWQQMLEAGSKRRSLFYARRSRASSVDDRTLFCAVVTVDWPGKQSALLLDFPFVRHLDAPACSIARFDCLEAGRQGRRDETEVSELPLPS